MLLWFGCESWCVFGPAGLFECSFRLFPCVSLFKINRSPVRIASGSLLPGLLMAIHIHLQPACGTTGAKPDWHVHAHTHTYIHCHVWLASYCSGTHIHRDPEKSCQTWQPFKENEENKRRLSHICLWSWNHFVWKSMPVCFVFFTLF